MLVSVAEAEERLDELVDLVEAGGEVILTIDGKPVVQLTPIGRDQRSGALALPVK